MPFAFRKITISLVLLSLLTLALFSFAGMTYGPDGRMQSDCPFSNMGTSLCPQNALPGAIHHLSAYHSFINVPMNPGITALIISLLIIVSIALAFSFHPLLYGPPVFIKHSYTSPPFTPRDEKIKRWLSLFEHSPSRL